MTEDNCALHIEAEMRKARGSWAAVNAFDAYLTSHESPILGALPGHFAGER